MADLPSLAGSLMAAWAGAVIVHTYSWMAPAAVQHPTPQFRLAVHDGTCRTRQNHRNDVISATIPVLPEHRGNTGETALLVTFQVVLRRDATE
jgi:hypothetical protein